MPRLPGTFGLAALAALLAGCTFITGDPRAPHLPQGLDFGVGSDAAGACEDLLGDPHNCGACGHDCTTLPGVFPSMALCVLGHCDVHLACKPGLAHCTAAEDDGCETPLRSVASCGGCGLICTSAAPLCTGTNGVFACSSSCGGATPDLCGLVCVDRLTDAAHCGSCTNVCPGTACVSGVCATATCATGFHMCPSGGCASDTSVTRCGAACSVCTAPANGKAVCAAGTCDFSCNPTYTRVGASCAHPDFTSQTSGVSANLNAVFARGDSDVFAVGNGGLILRSMGDGTWSAATSPTVQRLNNVNIDAMSVVYAVGGLGAMVRLDDNSDAWDSVTSNTSENLFGLFGAGATLYAAGTHGALDVSSDSGHATWAVQTLGTENEHSIWQSSDGMSTYVVGQTGVIRFSNGSGFTQQTSGVSTFLNGVWGSSASDVYVVGQSGVILHSTGDGSWTAQTSGTPGTLWWVWGSGAQDLYVVGDQGVALHSTGNGVWKPLASGVTTSLFSVWGSSSSDVYVVGQNGVILHRP